jgi:hypothetical protein
MDPRERADATLARARARGAFVVTPESAISPMDAANTLQIPRAVVAAIDRRDDDPEATMVVPAVGRPHPVPAQGPPTEPVPAIAQEASTQVLTPRRQPVEGQTNPMPWAPPAPPPPPEPEQVEGLIPTVKHPPANRSNLSQRLDG